MSACLRGDAAHADNTPTVCTRRSTNDNKGTQPKYLEQIHRPTTDGSFMSVTCSGAEVKFYMQIGITAYTDHWKWVAPTQTANSVA